MKTEELVLEIIHAKWRQTSQYSSYYHLESPRSLSSLFFISNYSMHCRYPDSLLFNPMQKVIVHLRLPIESCPAS